MAWQPSAEPLNQLAGYLKDSLNGSDPAAQKRATEILREAEHSPDINNYLTYLLVNADAIHGFSAEDWHLVRQAASLLLKNHIKQNFQQIPPTNLEYLKSNILRGLQDPHAQIRGVTGNVITELVRQGGILSWTDLLTRLLALVENSDPSLGELSAGPQEGAMSALAKVCEDNKRSLDRDYNGNRPLNFLIPKFLQFTSSPHPKIRAYSLGCVNIFLPNKTQSVLVHIDSLIRVIFSLAQDSSNAVRREVCRAIVHIVDICPDKLYPHLNGIVDYMISQQLKVEETDLSLDAAEFWLTAGEHDQLKMGLGPYLDKIVPTLLKSMVYSDEDIARLGGALDDADVEDKAEDIKPVFAKSKPRVPNGDGTGAAELGTNGNKTAGEIALDELSDGEIDELTDEEGDEDPQDQWNLRKCSAAALDVLASVYHQPIFDIILPYLKENLRSEQWPYREAAVLALGAVAEGCLDAVIPHLPELIPYLLTLLNDHEPLVRQITCWTLGRYSRWAAHLPDKSLQQRFYVPMMEGLLTKMLDGNKRVQEAGASAFASLEEQSQQALTPYIQPILRQFVTAMDSYKDRNMFILYDCIQTLAEHVGQALSEKQYVDILMPALIKRWEKVKDNSRELFPLLECLSYVATALGMVFAPFAAPIFYRCVGIIHQNLEMYIQAARADREGAVVSEWPDKDFLVTSLDLLSAVIQALDSTSTELVANAQPGFFDLLIICMGDPNNDVRQSSYALLGDCAIYVFPQLQPYLHRIVGLLIEQLDMSGTVPEFDDLGIVDTGYSVVNNACWSCGEIALKQGTGMTPYVEQLYTRLLKIVQTSDIPSSVTENAAIAIGRLGLGSCDDLAPHLESFARPFLDAIKNVAETDEKDTALRGFTMIVGRNPEAMESCLVPFFRCIARYREPSQELHELFQQTLSGYQRFIQDFNSFMNQLPRDIRQELRERYRV